MTVHPHTHAAVAFPLGGIGTGNVSLGARGNLRDWEIFNRPAKGLLLPNTFFAVRARPHGAPPVVRVLEGPLTPPHTLSHGYHPNTAAGLPRMASSTLHGEYPFARVVFDDPRMPLCFELEAFTPLIPLNPHDSGLPCAILTFSAHNPGAVPVDLTLVGSLFNPIGGIGLDPYGNLNGGGLGGNLNEFRDTPALRGMSLASTRYPADALEYGNLALVTDHLRVTYKRAWLRGGWWDFLQEFWDDFCDDGLLTDLGYDTPSVPGQSDTASLAVVDTLGPGERRSYRFVLAWFFPNRPNSWEHTADHLTQNQYATRFASAWDVAAYTFAELPRLEQTTRAFHAALFGSTLPAPVIDALASNIVPLRSTTCFWLADGRFFGWEGCFDQAGCCAGSCTHVWSYAQTLAFLFPQLEREMRRIEFAVETAPDGYMFFRSYQTFGERFVWSWGAHEQPQAAVDGQMGSVLRVYREWLLSGDRDWLEQIWPAVKRSVSFAGRQWDTDGDGVLDGRQHNTYDIEFYGPNPLCGIYYLAALRAAEELAHVLDEPDVAQAARAIFEKGSQRLDELLWNGEYYIQLLDDVDAHKYQHGQGILSDQLLGQLHARILGLGDLLPPAHVRTAVKAIFDHNFRRDFTEHVNCQRTYVLNDESGLLLCSWPQGGRPKLPFVYSDEVWTGFEYQVAAHLIYEGWLSEGLEIVAAARARHDGIRRNPWNEVECGHHYARSMASWALLTALSGFSCNVAERVLRFAPVAAASSEANEFRCFWACGAGWGTYSAQRTPTGWIAQVQTLGGDISGWRIEHAGSDSR